MITNTDITIYSREYNTDTRQDDWNRTYVSAAWWFKDEKASITTDGLKKADIYTVRIPDTSISLKKDDYIVKGDCHVDMRTVKDLEGLEKTRVTSVNHDTFGSNPHVKAGGV